MLSQFLSLAVAASEAPPPLLLPPGHPSHRHPLPRSARAYNRGRRRFRVALAAGPWHRASGTLWQPWRPPAPPKASAGASGTNGRACRDGSHRRVGGIRYPPLLDRTFLCDDTPTRSVCAPRGGGSGGVGAHGADGLRAKRRQAARDAARDGRGGAVVQTLSPEL